MEFTKVTKPLRLDLQFFAEGNKEDETTTADEPKNTEKQPPQSHMIPKSRFDEVNTKYKELQEQLDSLLAKQQEQERKAQEEQGRYQELYQQTAQDLESVKSTYQQTEQRAKQLEGVMNDLLEAKMANVPEQFQELIPDNLTPEQKLAWISKAETKGLFAPKAEKPVGGSTNPSEQQTIEVEALSPFQKLKMGYGSK